jgi:hypothetical protein
LKARKEWIKENDRSLEVKINCIKKEEKMDENEGEI